MSTSPHGIDYSDGRLAAAEAALTALRAATDGPDAPPFPDAPSGLASLPAREPTTRDAAHWRTRRAATWTRPARHGQPGPRPLR